MSDDTPTTSDAEFIAVPALLAAFIAWPFFHPFHGHHDAVMYWVWGTPILVGGVFLLVVQPAVRAVLRRTETERRE